MKGRGSSWFQRIILAVAGLLALALLQACSCQKNKKKLDDAPGSVVSSTTSGSTPTTATGAALLTPEQMSRQIAVTLGYSLLDGGTTGNDLVRDVLAVPLGGVDFDAARQRDPVPKVQNLLLVRLVAFNAAVGVMQREQDPGQRLVFKDCDPTADRPLAVGDTSQAGRDADTRWAAQINSLYLRIFARPPTTADVTLHRNAFNSVLQGGDVPLSAWTVVLFGLLANSEFWNI